jgi:hypothetical protein
VAGLHLGAIPPGQAALVRGLSLAALPVPGIHFVLEGAGVSWAEECTSQASDDLPGAFAGEPGLYVANGAAVVVRCELRGSAGADAATGPAGENWTATGGRSGLDAVGCRLAVHATVATGGAGGDGANDGIPAFGGTGLATIGAGHYSVLGGIFTGGDEGVDNSLATKPGYGAFFLFSAAADVRDATMVAGAVNGAGTPVPALSGAFTTITTYAAALRELEISSPVRELAAATVTVSAVPGDMLSIFVTTAPGVQAMPSKQGSSVIGDPAAAVLVPLGVVTDPSGVLSTELVLPRLPAGVEGMVLYTQLGVVGAAGEALLGTGSALVWLSATL